MALNTQAAPLMNLFELGVAEGKTVKYDQVAKHNISTSIANEKGTLAMYSVKLQANPEIAYMLEIYADNAVYQIHRDSSQYQAFANQQDYSSRNGTITKSGRWRIGKCMPRLNRIHQMIGSFLKFMLMKPPIRLIAKPHILKTI